MAAAVQALCDPPQHDPRCSTSPSSRSTSTHATHSLSWLPMAIQILPASCLVEGWVLFKPTPPDCQLARALYRLVRGASKVLLNLDARTRAFLCLVTSVSSELKPCNTLAVCSVAEASWHSVCHVLTTCRTDWKASVPVAEIADPPSKGCTHIYVLPPCIENLRWRGYRALSCIL